MHTNTHAFNRMAVRLTEAEKADVIDTANIATEIMGKVDFAVYALKLGAMRHSNDSSTSNGQNVVAVVRGGVLKTVMLRRDNQPATAEALNVSKVLRL